MTVHPLLSTLCALATAAGGPPPQAAGAAGILLQHAILSPSRVMIGRNVRIEGLVGTRYGVAVYELYSADGDPLVMRGDFEDLDGALDPVMAVLYDRIALHDADGDNRLNVADPGEAAGLIGRPALPDHDGDGFVDDFDLFLARYDADSDGGVVYDPALACGAVAEFDADLLLARLIDEARPDRDGDGLEAGPGDFALGYRDGVLDVLDQYAKLRGSLRFAVARDAWEVAHGESFQTVVHGPIRPGAPGEAPVRFEVARIGLPEITTAMIDSSSSWFAAVAQTGVPFFGQVWSQIALGGEFVPPGPDTWESIPYGSCGAYDWYQRPIVRNMTFTNVRIPMGTNALFESCTFIGVTFIETETDCVHPNWNYAGALERFCDPGGPCEYVPKFPGTYALLDGVPVLDTKPFSNNLRFHDCTFLGSVSGDKPEEFTHWRNAVVFSGATRFYIDPDDPDLGVQPDAASLLAILEGMDPADREELVKSSLFLPGWAVDVINDDAGAPPDVPRVKLRGTIVAGLFGARGRLDVRGTVLITFRAVQDEGPLYYGGQPGDFATSIGCFEAQAGEPPGFCEISLRIDPGATLPDGLPSALDTAPLR